MEGDSAFGASEYVDTDYEVASASAGCYDMSFKAAEGAADYADTGPELQGAADEFHGGVGLAEHEEEGVNLGGRYGCHGAAEFVGGGCFVGQETVDEGEGDDGPALAFGAMDKDGRSDDYAVDHVALAVAPHAQFFLCRCKAVVAFIGEEPG